MRKWFAALIVLVLVLLPATWARADSLSVSAVYMSNVLDGTATVNWETNNPSLGWVDYGITTAYGNVQYESGAAVTLHAVSLVGLAPTTTYHVRVTAQASGETAVSGDYAFTTLASQSVYNYTPPSYLDANLFGKSSTFTIDDKGKVPNQIIATSADQAVVIFITPGTVALDINKNPLATLTIVPDVGPPRPPTNNRIVGTAYRFAPDTASIWAR